MGRGWHASPLGGLVVHRSLWTDGAALPPFQRRLGRWRLVRSAQTGRLVRKAPSPAQGFVGTGRGVACPETPPIGAMADPTTSPLIAMLMTQQPVVVKRTLTK